MSSKCIPVTLLILLSVGCTKSRPPPPPAAPISGKVTFASGRPIADMLISFHPQDDASAGGKRPSAVLSKDGTYATEAIPGRYKATLAPIPSGSGAPDGSSLALPPGKNSDKDAGGVPARFRDAQSSSLEVTVPAGGGELPVLIVR